MRRRMRKLTLVRLPETVLADARNEAAAVLARVWTGEVVAPARKARAAVPRLRHALPRTPREPLETVLTQDLRHLPAGRLMPRVANMRLGRIDYARGSAWFDAASAERLAAANRAFEILRAMLAPGASGASLPRTRPTPAPPSS